MFENITVHNYKGFETASIPIRPITFFVGRNSSGKSSIVQLLLAIYQTQTGRKKHPTHFLNNGKQIIFGKAENLWRNKDKRNELELIFALKNTSDFVNLIKTAKAQFITNLFHN